MYSTHYNSTDSLLQGKASGIHYKKQTALIISKQDFLNKFSILADKYNSNKQVALDLCELLIKNFKEDGKL